MRNYSYRLLEHVASRLRSVAFNVESNEVCACSDLSCSDCLFNGNCSYEDTLKKLTEKIEKEITNNSVVMPESYHCGIGKNLLGEYVSCNSLDCTECKFYSSNDCVSALISEYLDDSAKVKGETITEQGVKFLNQLVDVEPFGVNFDKEIQCCETMSCFNCIFSEFSECVPEKRIKWLKEDKDKELCNHTPSALKDLKINPNESYGVKDNVLTLCDDLDCHECEFYGSKNCSLALLEWFLKQIELG